MLDDGDERCIDDISKDLHRQFPFHEMFMQRSGGGQEDLFRVLKAYSVHNPKVGYEMSDCFMADDLLTCARYQLFLFVFSKTINNEIIVKYNVYLE